MQIDLPDSVVEFMRNLAHEIKTQDSRATASPYYYVVRMDREHPTADGCGDKVGYYSADECQSYTKEEALAKYKELAEENEWDEDLYSFEDYLEEEYRSYDIGYHIVEDNVFLTYKAYKAHRLSIDPAQGSDHMEIWMFSNPEDHQAVLVARLDNLGKGAAGAAVQNLKLMLALS